jgi:cell division protein FtsZ
MKDAVKITVIATGFQRDSLPQLTRRPPAVAFESLMPEPAPPPPAPVLEPVLAASSFFHETPPAPPPPPAPEIEEPAAVAAEDIEIPAFMRRERRLYQ